MTSRVLVTGGGSGIGRAVVEALVAAGSRVVVTGRRAEPLDRLEQTYPGKVHALRADLTESAARDGLLERAAALLGGLDGLVHSAGVVFHEEPGTITEPHLREQLEIHLVAPLRLGEAALRVLEPGGSMVFVSSTLAVRPVVTSAVYSAAKAGLLQVMRVLALAGAVRQIRANAVLPGVVATDMLDAPRHLGGGQDQVAALRALHPLGRLGTPGDVARSIVYLLDSPWITGTELVVDGGLLIHP